jgi:hypothetical protein
MTSSSSSSSTTTTTTSSLLALTITTGLFFAVNVARLYYEENNKSFYSDLEDIVKTAINNVITTTKDIKKVTSITPKKKICNIVSSTNESSSSSSVNESSSSTSINELNTPPSLNIDDVDFGTYLETTDKKKMNITNDIIDDLDNLVKQMEEKENHIYNNYQKTKKLSIEITSPKINDNNENDIEDQLIMSISPNREIETAFNNNNNIEEELLNSSKMSLMTPNSSFMILPSPINISTVKSKTKKSSLLNTIKSQNNTPMSSVNISALSPLTVDNSFNHCHETLLTPDTVRSEFSESKIIGFSAIKQLPMDLMDYSLDSDFGQGSDVEESPVKPIRNSTMTKNTRTTKATMITRPTPVPFFYNKENSNNNFIR